VAEAIFEAIQCEKEMAMLSEVQNTDGYDLLFVGFPIEAFGPAQPAREFMSRYLWGKRVALFITHASPENSDDLPPWIEACKEAATGADIAGLFNCQGELAPDITEALKASDDPKLRLFGEQGPATKGKPDASSLERAKAFAREMTS
jgi:hypothetical protein